MSAALSEGRFARSFLLPVLSLTGLVLLPGACLPAQAAKFNRTTSARLISANNTASVTYSVDTTDNDASLNACTAAAADCSLRGAITKGENDGTETSIEFNSSVFNSPKTIDLSTSLPAITQNLTITGPAAGVTINFSSFLGSFSVFTVTANTLTLLDLTIQGGNGPSGQDGTGASGKAGGLQVNGGAAVVRGCTFYGNYGGNGGASPDGAAGGAGGAGAAQASGGTLELTNCTFSGNSGASGGNGGRGRVGSPSGAGGSGGAGAVQAHGGTVQVRNCTFKDNGGGSGGSGGSGGIDINSGMVIPNGPDGAQGAGALGVVSGSATTGGSLYATNYSPNSNSNLVQASGTLTSQGFNLSTDSGGGFLNDATDQTGVTDPGLDSVLRNNGGPTSTFALFVGSPAIEKGKDLSGTGEDQRGEGRPFNDPGIAPAPGGDNSDIGAYEVRTLPDTAQSGADFVVNTTSDVNDGVCGVAHCSLREAIYAGNANNDASKITFNIPDAQKVGSAWTITLGSPLDTLATNVRITGPGARLLTVKARDAFLNVFSISGSVTISGLTVSSGNYGVHNGGTLTVLNCMVIGTNNNGFYNEGGTMTLINCAASANLYGISNGGGSLTAINCTASGNLYGLANSNNRGPATMTAINCTSSGNDGGLILFGGTVTLRNSLVVGNSTNINSFGNTVNSGTDSITTGTAHDAGLETTDNINAVVLKYNGGPTDTIALSNGAGTAINAGNNTLLRADTYDLDGDNDTLEQLPFDQRNTGFPRIVNGTVDIGAFERGTPQRGDGHLVVTSTADPGDGTCDFAGVGDGCTLREAITLANEQSGADTITFAATVTPKITLTNDPLPQLSTDMTIQGPGAAALTLDAQQNSRIFFVFNGTANGPTVTLSGLTLMNGKASAPGTFPDDRAGAILNDRGTLTVTACTLSQNSAPNGGGIYSEAAH